MGRQDCEAINRESRGSGADEGETRGAEGERAVEEGTRRSGHDEERQANEEGICCVVSQAQLMEEGKKVMDDLMKTEEVKEMVDISKSLLSEFTSSEMVTNAVSKLKTTWNEKGEQLTEKGKELVEKGIEQVQKSQKSQKSPKDGKKKKHHKHEEVCVRGASEE